MPVRLGASAMRAAGWLRSSLVCPSGTCTGFSSLLPRQRKAARGPREQRTIPGRPRWAGPCQAWSWEISVGCWAVRREERSGWCGTGQGPVLNPIAEEIGHIVVLASWQMRVEIGDQDGCEKDARNSMFFFSLEKLANAVPFQPGLVVYCSSSSRIHLGVQWGFPSKDNRKKNEER
ncbi:hypothetical protein F5144DRAFT_345240 [Chaetomium tenue]|uniref:Uncharacterized protein n=1 Tax=Chaetomium tenue TaxID=1854479 RepID=A0ACB7NXB1_9PEZI|nr:hypothetical protein F5144DRAFT_345240 [Chaetomium globosum]